MLKLIKKPFAILSIFSLIVFSLLAQETTAQKLRSIIFDKVVFDEVDVVEAFEFIRNKSKELDKDKKGINILLNNIKRGELFITFDMSDIPAVDLIKYICLSTDLEYKIEKHAVIISKKKPDTQK